MLQGDRRDDRRQLGRAARGKALVNVLQLTEGEKVQATLPVRSFDETRSGELVSRVMDDVEGVRNLVGTGLVQLVGGTLTAVVAMGFLVSIDPVMTALALVPLGLFGIVSTKAFKTLRPAFRERGKIRAEVKGRLTESLGGIRVIKGFHAVEREREVFEAGVMRLVEKVPGENEEICVFAPCRDGKTVARVKYSVTRPALSRDQEAALIDV